MLFGHWALVWIEQWLRDFKRLEHVAEALDECPLGAAALAGSTLPLDRAFTAKALGFSRVAENSLDAVSNRDYLVDFAYALAMLMQHLSRLGEELVLYTSQEYGFLKLGDAIATGSSLMPQKRNPDVAELLRGRAGRAYGLLIQLLTLLKGQPLAYNRDMQEDKEAFFQTFDLVLHCVRLLPVLAENLAPDAARMRQACQEGFWRPRMRRISWSARACPSARPTRPREARAGMPEPGLHPGSPALGRVEDPASGLRAGSFQGPGSGPSGGRPPHLRRHRPGPGPGRLRQGPPQAGGGPPRQALGRHGSAGRHRPGLRLRPSWPFAARPSPM